MHRRCIADFSYKTFRSNGFSSRALAKGKKSGGETPLAFPLEGGTIVGYIMWQSFVMGMIGLPSMMECERGAIKL